jgi:hypothetical protein
VADTPYCSAPCPTQQPCVASWPGSAGPARHTPHSRSQRGISRKEEKERGRERGGRGGGGKEGGREGKGRGKGGGRSGMRKGGVLHAGQIFKSLQLSTSDH